MPDRTPTPVEQGNDFSASMQRVFGSEEYQQRVAEKAQKQAEDQAWEQSSFMQKAGITLGKALQPLEYLNYGRRALETGVLEALELGMETEDTPQWLKWATTKPEQLGFFEDPAKTRGGRSNWELIKGETGEYEGVEQRPLGFGDMVQNTLRGKGPTIPLPFGRSLNTGDVADTSIGIGGDIGLDPLTYTGTGGFRVINPAVRATIGAGVADDAARGLVDDLARQLTAGSIPEAELNDVVSRVSQQLDLAERARLRAASAPNKTQVVRLPRNRMGRSQLAAELKETMSPEDWVRLQPDIEHAVRHGFEQASPELKDAARLLPGGLRVAGFRVPGTQFIGTGVGATRAAIGSKIPGRLSMIRDPQGLGEALDVAARGKAGDFDSAITRLGLEDWRDVAEGRVRQFSYRELRKFNKEVLKPLSKVGREAVDDMVHEAETHGGTRLNDLMNRVLDIFEKETGRSLDPEFLLDKDTYVPHKMSNAFKKYLRKNKDLPNAQAFMTEAQVLSDDLLSSATAIARKRVFKPTAIGTPTPIRIGDTTIDVADGSIRELNQELKKVFPGFEGNFYETDPAVLLESYVQQRAREAGIQSALNRLAANPRFAAVQRVQGELAAELEARNAALNNDPLQQLLKGDATVERATEYAQDQLGAVRGPGQAPGYGPYLPEAPTHPRPLGQAPAPSRSPYQDSVDSILRSEADPVATEARNKLLSSAEVKAWQDALKADRKKFAGSLKEAVAKFKDTATQGLRKGYKVSTDEIKAQTKALQRLRLAVKRADANEATALADLEQVLSRNALDLAEAQDALDEAVRSAGAQVSAKEKELIDSLRERVDEVIALRDEAVAKLETAPARMRAEVRERAERLGRPIEDARHRLEKVKATIDADGPSRTKIRNAEAVVEPPTYRADKNRLDSLEPGPERRALQRKFARGSEYSKYENAQQVLRDRDAALGRHADDLAKAQRDYDIAKAQAAEVHESVVRGKYHEPLPLLESDPAHPSYGQPVWESIDPPVQRMEPGWQEYHTGEGGFGARETREAVAPENLTPEEAAAQARAFGRRQQGLPPERVPAGQQQIVGPRTEQEALDALRKAARDAEAGTGPLARRVEAAEARIAPTEQALRTGTYNIRARTNIGPSREVEQVRAAAQVEVDQAVQDLAAAQGQGAAKEAAARQNLAAATQKKAQIDGEIDQALANREILYERRNLNQEQARELQKDLRAQAKKATVRKRATMEELEEVYGDLVVVALANPTLADNGLRSVETQMNRIADGLLSMPASNTTYHHVTDMVRAANRGELGPIMRTTLGVGWKSLHDGALKTGDIIVRGDLHRMMTNLIKLETERVPLTRAFQSLTNMFKTYATLSPGFHVRNALSAIFMNTADDVSLLNQALGARIWTGFMLAERRGTGTEYIEGLTKKYPHLQDALDATVASGAGGRFGELGFAEPTAGAGSKFWSWVNNNRATRLSKKGGEWVEGGVRLGMALDSIAKGESVEAALQRITRVHFNYAKTSRFDEWAKVFVPFWTYYSRNLPLQIQMIYTQPKAYSWFMSAMNTAPPDEAFTPEYWDQPGNFNTGEQVPGGTLYGNFDLPFSRSAEQIEDLTGVLQLDFKGVFSQGNPWMVAPVEFFAGKDFFTEQTFSRTDAEDYQNLGGVVGQTIGAIGGALGQNDPAGRTYKPFTSMIRSTLPMFDRAARMDPTGAVFDVEGQQQLEPMWTSYARWAGAPVRVLTPEQQRASQIGQFRDRQRAAQFQRAAQAYLAGTGG